MIIEAGRLVPPRFVWLDAATPWRSDETFLRDNRVLECAIEAGAQVIVTGDAHLLKLEKYEGIAILTPRQFLGNSG